MYSDFYDYDEPSEFEMQIDEWKETLRSEVKKEYQEEMARLKEENAKLMDIKNNWNKKVSELEREKAKLNNAIRTAGKEAKKMRLRELLEDFTKQAWGFKGKYEYIREKCDKCNKHGYIHYKSPQGRDVKEKCNCRKSIYFYSPVEAEIVEFEGRRGDENIKIYFEYKRNNFEDVGRDNYTLITKIYNGQDFDSIDCCFGMIFFDKEDCQRFCDYLNKKQRGIGGSDTE